jgi:hypothetical protein
MYVGMHVCRYYGPDPVLRDRYVCMYVCMYVGMHVCRYYGSNPVLRDRYVCMYVCMYVDIMDLVQF